MIPFMHLVFKIKGNCVIKTIEIRQLGLNIVYGHELMLVEIQALPKYKNKKYIIKWKLNQRF